MEQPRPPHSLFWVFAVAGSAFIVGFAAFDSMGASLHGDLLLLAAIVVCGLGYAGGARRPLSP